MIRVILMLDCSSEFDRRLLRGIMRYSKENGSWQFYRMPSSLRSGTDREQWVVDWVKQWKADAVIGRWDENKVELLDSLDIPIVLQNYRSRSAVYSNLTGDYIGTGRLAARSFIKKRFRRFAYFGVRNVVWSEERREGFQEEIEKVQGDFHSLMVDPFLEDTMLREQVGSWLKSLPKPVAMFACDDAHALFITETCKMSGIRIPNDIALLGVDNDELLCEISDPPISSIELDVEQGGYTTCRLLHERILGKDRSPFSVVINPKTIIRRSSDKSYDIKDTAVAKVVEHIENHYTEDVTVEDLMRQASLSRRALEIRFRKEMHNTLYQFLTECRIEQFAYLLVTTKKPLYEIAYEDGFKDGTNYSRIFRKHKNCSPIEYRNLAGLQPE